MKVQGPGGLTPAGGGKPGAKVGAGGFTLGQTAAPSGPAPTVRAGGVSGVASVDALLALQEMGGPLERRRKAMNRAGRILDVLDEVKIALIDGEVSTGALDRLVRAIRSEREGTDDPRLEGVLNEIETRAAVELAKLEQAKPAA
jgi:hypothetical protein